MKTRMSRFMFWHFLAILIFMAACTDSIQPQNEEVATAVSTLTPTMTQTVTAVPTTTPQPTNTAVLTPTSQNQATALPESAESEADVMAIKTTPTQLPTATPPLTDTPLVTETWPTLISQEYGFSLQYPPGWAPVTTLPNRVSLVREGTSIALRIMVKFQTESVNLVRSGVAAGDFTPREQVFFLGQLVSSDVLVYQNKDKAVFYEKADEIVRGNLVFAITLESNRMDYEAIVIPPDVQAEADAIVASVKLVTDDALPWPETKDLTLLYNQRGRLFQFDTSSQTAAPLTLPVQGEVRDALLSGDGRYLALADDAGLNLYDMSDGTNQLWLPSSVEPWQWFQPRAWNQADELLVQRIWGTENSALGRAKIGDAHWRSLPLPADTSAEFYSLDSGAAWSPDGTRLALGGYDYAIPSSVPGLAVIDLETGLAQLIVTQMITSGIEGGDPLVAGAYDPAWSPDGAWIAFGLEENAIESLNFPVRLYRVRPNGADLVPLTDNLDGQVGHPLWTAVDALIYSLTGSSDTTDGIYTYDVTAQTHSLLIPGSDLAPISFSADGRFLAYRQTRHEGRFVYQDLRLWSLDAGQSLLVAAGRDGDPARFAGWQSAD